MSLAQTLTCKQAAAAQGGEGLGNYGAHTHTHVSKPRKMQTRGDHISHGDKIKKVQLMKTDIYKDPYYHLVS